MLKTTLTGNLIADAELRYLDDGRCIIKFTVASNVREQNADKEWDDVGYFYRVTTMPRSDSQREYIERNAIKGAKALVSGTPKANAYMSRDNEPRVGLEIAFPDVLEFPGSKPNGHRESDDSSGEAEAKPRATASTGAKSNGSSKPAAKAVPAKEESPELDDLPF